MTIDRHTLVDIRYRKNRINHRILFGKSDQDIRRSWHTKAAAFLPGQVFGYERWAANRFGTQQCSIVVCRAAIGPRITRLDGVFPGAELWLRAVGKAQVKRVFAATDAMRKSNLVPDKVTQSRWRAVHNLVQGRECPVSLVRSWSC